MSTHPHPSKIYLHPPPVMKNVQPSEIYPHPPIKNVHPPNKNIFPPPSHPHSLIKNVHSPPPTQNIPQPTSTHPHLPIKYPPSPTHPHPPIKMTTLTHSKYTSKIYHHPAPPTLKNVHLSLLTQKKGSPFMFSLINASIKNSITMISRFFLKANSHHQTNN